MKKIINIFYYIIPTLLLIYAFFCALNNYIWADEAFSLIIANKSYTNVLEAMLRDVHPPLYFLILKLGLDLFTPIYNNQIFVAKFISFIPLIILVINGFTLIKDLYGKLTSFVFNILIVSMPSMILFSVEIRMYIYSCLFVLLSLLYTIKIRRGNNYKDWVYLTFYTILSVYSHYYSCIASISLYIYLMVFSFKSKKIKRFLLSSIIVVSLFLPWVILQAKMMLGSEMVSSFWIQSLTSKDLLNIIKFPFSVMRFNFISYILISITLILIALILKNIKKENNKEALLSLYVLAFIVFVGVTFSYLIKPVFILRYMFPGFGAFWLAISISITNNIVVDKLKYITIFIFLMSGSVVITERKIIENEYEKEYLKMYSAISNSTLPIITDNFKTSYTLSYYYSNNDYYLLEDNNLISFDTKYSSNIDNLINIEKEILVIIKDETLLDIILDKVKDKELLGEYYLDNVGNLKIYKYRFSN